MRQSRTTVTVLGSLFLLSFAALSQVSTGTLVGTVLDATGAVVPNAKVVATNVATGVTASTVATGVGDYRIGGLIAGAYSATASATGFTGSTLQGLTIDANKTVTANFSLAVGAVSTTVEVTTESAAIIDTTTATIQTTFDTQMVRDLPVSGIGLGVANLSLLGAGVSSNGGIGAGEGPSVGGQRPRNNNFMIEGVDANNKTVTGSLIRTMPNDAVAEFTILQNQQGAQYGHSSGGQFNTILKSGTNAFHGTAYEYMQNRNLNAIDQVVQNQAISAGVTPSNPRSDNNRFGGSIGGPVIKNKLFFFGLYEYNPVGASATPASLLAPTAAGYAALSGISGLSAPNLGILKQYLPPAVNANEQPLTIGNTSIPIGDLQVISPNYQNNQSTVETFDYNISDKDQLRGRYIYNRLSQVDVQASLPSFFTFSNNVYHVASLAEYHNFSPTLTNELRLGYNRFNQPVDAGNFKYAGLDAFPNITLDDLGGVNIGPDPNGPQTTIQNTYQLTDNVTWVKGAHTFQMGYDGRRSISPQTFTQRSRGDYDYSTLEGFLRDQTPDTSAQRSLGNPVYYGDQYNTYLYAQDAWRLRPNFTLNLGVRYEYTTVPVGERNQI
ncbi:MAG: carboxypeptidase regulatory-like domain-containing protein, partial [Terriglobia bacterium]